MGFTERHVDFLKRLDFHVKRCKAAPGKCLVKDRNTRGWRGWGGLGGMAEKTPGEGESELD